MRKIKKEASRVHTMSMEAACSERALMGFPAPSPSKAEQMPDKKRTKSKEKRKKIRAARGNLILLPKSEIFANKLNISIHWREKAKRGAAKKKGELYKLPPPLPWTA
jgi:hypothetical protein